MQILNPFWHYLKKQRVFLLILIVVTSYLLMSKNFDLKNLKNIEETFISLEKNYPYLTIALGLLFYIAYSALGLPGLTILSMSFGAIFGFELGVALVSIASTTGATLTFLVVRKYFHNSVTSRFPIQINELNADITRYSIVYLLFLRLIPLFPFLLVLK